LRQVAVGLRQALRRIKEQRKNAKIDPKEFQHSVDVYRVALFTQFYRTRDAEKAHKEVTEASLDERVALISTELMSQATTLLRASAKPSAHSFELAVETSSIPGAGLGVFLARGECLPGQLVMLYPGKVYNVEDLNDSERYKEVISSDYTFTRHDEMILDAAQWSKDPAVAPYALGHVLNHPPPHVLPNVLPVALDFPTTMAESHAPYFPTEWCDERRRAQAAEANMDLPCVALVASQHLQPRDELFLDYRFNPRLMHMWPPWYHAVDRREAGRRWGVW